MTKDQLKQLERELWNAADNLRANSDLKSSEYSTPVLGLIFLKFADNNYRRHEAEILAEFQKLKGTRREKKLSEIAIEKCGFYLPDHARYDYLLNLPEEKDIAKALKEAMKAIEEYKPELEGVLPKDEYFRLTRDPKTKTIPPVLIQDWFKDSQSKERVKATVQEVLNNHLPESYDRALFTKKCDTVFELMLNYASQGLKWAA
jgi:type I restriction enzyme M protein